MWISHGTVRLKSFVQWLECLPLAVRIACTTWKGSWEEVSCWMGGLEYVQHTSAVKGRCNRLFVVIIVKKTLLQFLLYKSCNSEPIFDLYGNQRLKYPTYSFLCLSVCCRWATIESLHSIRCVYQRHLMIDVQNWCSFNSTALWYSSYHSCHNFNLCWMLITLVSSTSTTASPLKACVHKFYQKN